MEGLCLGTVECGQMSSSKRPKVNGKDDNGEFLEVNEGDLLIQV